MRQSKLYFTGLSLLVGRRVVQGDERCLVGAGLMLYKFGLNKNLISPLGDCCLYTLAYKRVFV